MSWLTVILWALCVQFSLSDEGYYVNSIAAFDADAIVNLLHPPSVMNEVTTASTADAGTSGEIFITYVGTFSNSGPHSLGSFLEGAVDTIEIQLTRKIGELTAIVLETSSTDCWLMDSINVDMDMVRYQVYAPNTWLEAIDPITGKTHFVCD